MALKNKFPRSISNRGIYHRSKPTGTWEFIFTILISLHSFSLIRKADIDMCTPNTSLSGLSRVCSTPTVYATVPDLASGIAMLS
jgi:hypothetical protein